MKTTIMGIVVLALAVLVGMPSVASAQIEGSLNIDVPFEFWVGDTKLAKGKYQIRKADMGASDEEMVIASAAGHVAVIFTPISAIANDEPKKAEVSFKNYNGNRYLHTIFEESNRYGVQLDVGRSEKKEAKKSGAQPKVDKHPATK